MLKGSDLSLSSLLPTPHLAEPPPPPTPAGDDDGQCWTSKDKRKFKKALSEFSTDTENFYQKVASRIPGKTVHQVQEYFKSCYKLEGNIHVLVKKKGESSGSQTRKKYPMRGKMSNWTQNDHELFMLGLKEFGIGRWKKIAQNYVSNKTPSQVSTHAYGFFKRKEARRPEPCTFNFFKATSATTFSANDQAAAPSKVAAPPPTTLNLFPAPATVQEDGVTLNLFPLFPM